MDKEKSWEKITKIGEYVNSEWMKLSKEFNLPITISGLAALTTFSFKSENALAYKTFITQEMLNKGYLASTSVYVSIEHEKILEAYFSELENIFSIIGECENSGRDIKKLINGPVCHTGFERLN